MKTTRTQRQQQYESATPVQQYWYGAAKTTEIIGQLSEKHSLDETQHEAFVTSVGEVILSFTEPTALAESLQAAGVPSETATALQEDMAPFFTHLNEPLPADAVETEEEDEPEPVAQQSTVAAPAVASAAAVANPQIDAMRQQALVVWGQYLSAPVSTNTATYKAQVQSLAEQVEAAQASGGAVSASADPSAYWHEAVTRSRSRLPEIDDEAIARMRAEFGPGVAAPQSIINAIKGSAA